MRDAVSQVSASSKLHPERCVSCRQLAGDVIIAITAAARSGVMPGARAPSAAAHRPPHPGRTVRTAVARIADTGRGAQAARGQGPQRHVASPGPVPDPVAHRARLAWPARGTVPVRPAASAAVQAQPPVLPPLRPGARPYRLRNPPHRNRVGGPGVAPHGAAVHRESSTMKALQPDEAGRLPSLAKDSITSRHNDHREAGLPGKRDRHTECQSTVATHHDHNRPGRSTLVGDRQGGPVSSSATAPLVLRNRQAASPPPIPSEPHNAGRPAPSRGCPSRRRRVRTIVIATLGRLYIDDLDPSRPALKNTPGSGQGPAGRIRSFEPDHQHQGTLFVGCRHLPDPLPSIALNGIGPPATSEHKPVMPDPGDVTAGPGDVTALGR